MRRFFKFYFWFLILFYLAAIALSYGDDEPLNYLDRFDLLIGSLTLLGIFGYGYSKRIFSTLFWKCYLPLLVVWEIYYFYDLSDSAPEFFTEDYGMAFMIFIWLVFALLAFPSYVAIYLYGREKNT
jgi:hypothetical protein